MKNYYRDPQVEDGLHNIILQNRCGNRLTLLVREQRTDLELVYKPNAFRRKEHRARNFSNRDNFTEIFPAFALPEIGAGWIRRFDYDPFVTRIDVEAPSGATNRLTFVNVADENCFALAARCPLLLAFSPHAEFDVGDGLLTESFVDRGEEIVSFVRFAGLEENRFRVLDDGTHVLQVFENEFVLVGAEENVYQVGRACGRLDGMDLDELIGHTERQIAPTVSHGRLTVNDEELQTVLDVNARLTWSGLDAGGACFGALNRIYHLIWTRDGAMTASTFARAGRPDLAEIWTPFLLENPSSRLDEKGRRVREFLQIVGTRWTKTEDDGIYYAVLSLFSLWQSTGDDRLIAAGRLDELLAILDHTIADRFDTDRGLFGSDTLGETTLTGSPYYGYDLVSGKIDRGVKPPAARRPIRYAYSLYQNVNMYNCLRMAQVLIAAAGDGKLAETAGRYDELAGRIERALSEQFVGDDDCYRALLVIHQDGEEEWIGFERGDYWEYAWAVSTGPFLPDPATALRSVRMAVEVWPTVRSYGYCPWNFLARSLRGNTSAVCNSGS